MSTSNGTSLKFGPCPCEACKRRYGSSRTPTSCQGQYDSSETPTETLTTKCNCDEVVQQSQKFREDLAAGRLHPSNSRKQSYSPDTREGSRERSDSCSSPKFRASTDSKYQSSPKFQACSSPDYQNFSSSRYNNSHGQNWSATYRGSADNKYQASPNFRASSSPANPIASSSRYNNSYTQDSRANSRPGLRVSTDRRPQTSSTLDLKTSFGPGASANSGAVFRSSTDSKYQANIITDLKTSPSPNTGEISQKAFSRTRSAGSRSNLSRTSPVGSLNRGAINHATSGSYNTSSLPLNFHSKESFMSFLKDIVGVIGICAITTICIWVTIMKYGIKLGKKFSESDRRIRRCALIFIILICLVMFQGIIMHKIRNNTHFKKFSTKSQMKIITKSQPKAYQATTLSKSAQKPTKMCDCRNKKTKTTQTIWTTSKESYHQMIIKISETMKSPFFSKVPPKQRSSWEALKDQCYKLRILISDTLQRPFSSKSKHSTSTQNMLTYFKNSCYRIKDKFFYSGATKSKNSWQRLKESLSTDSRKKVHTVTTKKSYSGAYWTNWGNGTYNTLTTWKVKVVETIMLPFGTKQKPIGYWASLQQSISNLKHSVVEIVSKPFVSKSSSSISLYKAKKHKGEYSIWNSWKDRYNRMIERVFGKRNASKPESIWDTFTKLRISVVDTITSPFMSNSYSSKKKSNGKPVSQNKFCRTAKENSFSNMRFWSERNAGTICTGWLASFCKLKDKLTETINYKLPEDSCSVMNQSTLYAIPLEMRNPPQFLVFLRDYFVQ